MYCIDFKKPHKGEIKSRIKKCRIEGETLDMFNDLSGSLIDCHEAMVRKTQIVHATCWDMTIARGNTIAFENVDFDTACFDSIGIHPAGLFSLKDCRFREISLGFYIEGILAFQNMDLSGRALLQKSQATNEAWIDFTDCNLADTDWENVPEVVMGSCRFWSQHPDRRTSLRGANVTARQLALAALLHQGVMLPEGISHEEVSEMRAAICQTSSQPAQRPRGHKKKGAKLSVA